MELLEVKTYRIGQISTSLSNKLLKKYLWHQESEQQAKRVYLLDQEQEAEEEKPIVTPNIYYQYFTVNNEILHFNRRHIEQIYAYYLMSQGVAMSVALNYVRSMSQNRVLTQRKEKNTYSETNLQNQEQIFKQYKTMNSWLGEHHDLHQVAQFKKLLDQVMMSYTQLAIQQEEKQFAETFVKKNKEVQQVQLYEIKLLTKALDEQIYKIEKETEFETLKLEIEQLEKLKVKLSEKPNTLEANKEVQVVSSTTNEEIDNIHYSKNLLKYNMSVFHSETMYTNHFHKYKIGQTLEWNIEKKDEPLMIKYLSGNRQEEESIISDTTQQSSLVLGVHLVDKKISQSQSKQLNLLGTTFMKHFVQISRLQFEQLKWHSLRLDQKVTIKNEAQENIWQQISHILSKEDERQEYFLQQINGLLEKKDGTYVRSSLSAKVYANHELQEQLLRRMSRSIDKADELIRKLMNIEEINTLKKNQLIEHAYLNDKINNSIQTDQAAVNRLFFGQTGISNKEMQEELLQQLSHFVYKKDETQRRRRQEEKIYADHELIRKLIDIEEINSLKKKQFIDKAYMGDEINNIIQTNQQVVSRLILDQKGSLNKTLQDELLVYTDHIFVNKLIETKRIGSLQEKNTTEQVYRNDKINNSIQKDQAVVNQLILDQTGISNKELQEELLQRLSLFVNKKDEMQLRKRQEEKIYANHELVRKLVEAEEINSLEKKQFIDRSYMSDKINNIIQTNQQVVSRLILEQKGSLNKTLQDEFLVYTDHIFVNKLIETKRIGSLKGKNTIEQDYRNDKINNSIQTGISNKELQEELLQRLSLFVNKKDEMQLRKRQEEKIYANHELVRKLMNIEEINTLKKKQLIEHTYLSDKINNSIQTDQAAVNRLILDQTGISNKELQEDVSDKINDRIQSNQQVAYRLILNQRGIIDKELQEELLQKLSYFIHKQDELQFSRHKGEKIEYIDANPVSIVYQEKETKQPVDKPEPVEASQPDIEFKRIETKTKTIEKKLEDEVSTKTMQSQFNHLINKSNHQTILKESNQIVNQQMINLISDKVYAKLQQRLKIEQLKRGL